MTVVLKEDYVQGLEEYHKFVVAIIEKNYDLGIRFFENYAWGLVSTTFYIKSRKGDFTAKISNYTEESEKQIQVDKIMSDFLRKEIPTSEYIETQDNKFSLRFKDPNGQEKLLRITKHLVGMSPFGMKYNYLESGINWLKKLHYHILPPENLIKLPYLSLDSSTKYLLHGDMTPNNLLIFFEKVDAVLDFGLSSIGPVEYDLGRLALFTWFRMPGVDFQEILQTTSSYYIRASVEFNFEVNKRVDIKEISINQKLIKHFAGEHCSSYLKDVLKHRKLYLDDAKWQADYDFVKTKLEELLRN